MKKIAILTSGGDAPGMNACIKILVEKLNLMGVKTVASLRGFKGLYDNDIVDIAPQDVLNIAHLGGTAIYTSRFPEFKDEKVQKQVALNLKKNKIDGVIAIGGDGTIRGAKDLYKLGVNIVVIPATIDNDVCCTEKTIGFDTAVNTVTSLINNLHDTSLSHERPCIVEVMGAGCGDLALMVGSASGADLILVPEVKLSEDKIIEKVKKINSMAKKSMLIVTNEQTYDAFALSKFLNEKLNIESRPVEIGHIQRGGTPCAEDRLLALKYSHLAVQYLMSGGSGVVCIKNGKPFACTFEDLNKFKKKFDFELYNLFN